MSSNSDRRQFLKVSASTAGALLFSGSIAKAFTESCGPFTPPQTSGPFYPGESQFGTDQDLTQVAGSSVRAKGQVVYVKGKVVDQHCNPIQNANVELWQACASGRYNSRKDPNTSAPLDPNFKYWAEAFTKEDGTFMFKTIIPGAYPADHDWTRPPHLHFKVSALGYRELVTQMMLI